MAVIYIAVLLVVLLVLNQYPVVVSEDFVFASKQDSLGERADLYATTLAGAGELTAETASHVMGLLDSEETRVIVTDARLRVLYDSSTEANLTGSLALLGETRAAAAGNDYFFSESGADAITSVASVPIMIGGAAVGTVCVYDTDSSRSALISDIRDNLRNVSVGIMAATIVICIFISQIFGNKISELLGAMRRVRDGEYDYRLEMRGDDEFTHLSRELNALSGHFEAVEDMRRRFVSDASHELKTPLASIKLLADSMVQSDDMPPEVMREFALDIAEETDRLSRLAERMLDISRIDSGALENPQPVDMTAAVERAAHMLEPLAAANGIDIELELEENCEIMASDDYAYRIAFNLIENAIKYNRRDGEVRAYLFRKDDDVEFIVRDTGIGIPSDDLDRVFDRFYRVDKARSRAEGGSGLGLAIVADAVASCGGTITAESEYDVGTSMTAVFPSPGKRKGAKK